MVGRFAVAPHRFLSAAASRWPLALFLALMMGLAALPGCSGCRKSPSAAKKQKQEEDPGKPGRVFARHGFTDAELIGLAKREETIVRESGELRLPRSSEALKLLQRLRDEAHRFAITYHRELRRRERLRSGLEDIAGIGPERRRALVRLPASPPPAVGRLSHPPRDGC